MKKEFFYSSTIVAIIFACLIFSCKKNDDNNTTTNNVCVHTTCVNSGVATASGTTCSCKCPNGYVGDSCQSNVFGTYSGILANTTTGTTSNATMILSGTAGASTFTINYGGNITATWGSQSYIGYFTVSSQTVNGNTFSGSGSFELGYLEFEFTQTTGALSNGFSFQGTL